MDEKEALAILKLEEFTDLDELVDAYDLLVFEVKNWVLQQTPVAILFEARIRKLEQLENAAKSLGYNAPVAANLDAICEVPKTTATELIPFLRTYEKQRATLLLHAAQMQSANGLIQVMRALIALQAQYQEVLLPNAEAVSHLLEPVIELTKVGQAMNSGVLIKLLENLLSDHSRLETTLQQQVEQYVQTSNSEGAELAVEWGRVLKINQLQKEKESTKKAF